MKLTEIFRLVWLNLASNKFKVFLTSTGIIVGSATIMLVIAIGTGGREEVAEQFKNLNAGAIDITYEYQGNDFGGGNAPFDLHPDERRRHRHGDFGLCAAAEFFHKRRL